MSFVIIYIKIVLKDWSQKAIHKYWETLNVFGAIHKLRNGLLADFSPPSPFTLLTLFTYKLWYILGKSLCALPLIYGWSLGEYLYMTSCLSHSIKACDVIKDFALKAPSAFNAIRLTNRIIDDLDFKPSKFDRRFRSDSISNYWSESTIAIYRLK